MTLLEIDLKKLEHNYRSLRKILNPKSKMIGVIKANAYGAVSESIAEKLVELGTEALAVAYVQEGIKLRQFGIKVPLLVFYPQIENFKVAINESVIHGWTTENYQSHHCPECSSESRSLSSESSCGSKYDTFLN